MEEDPKAQNRSTARWLAIAGGLITGLTGIFMAVYSVIAGEETGAGALLAASALAFGFLAWTLERKTSHSSQNDALAGNGRVDVRDPPDQTALRSGTVPSTDANPLSPSPVNGSSTLPQRGPDTAQIDPEPITHREREVLTLVAEGYSNKLIGLELSISERTVKNHLTITLTKLRASDRTHAVVTAFRMGWPDI